MTSEDKKLFVADYDKQGRASCKKCKQKLEKGAFRLGKVAPNPFGEGDMKQWHHPSCLFDSFLTSRATTAKITSLSDCEGYKDLKAEDRDKLQSLIDKFSNSAGGSKVAKKPTASPSKPMENYFPVSPTKTVTSPEKAKCEDYLFSSFCQLCEQISNESSYKAKTAVVHSFLFKTGATGKHGFCGDVYCLLKLLLPSEKGLERVYNLNNKQIIKIFADLFGADAEAMSSATDEHGDVSVIVAEKFFAKSQLLKPCSKSQLTINDVDSFLDSMTSLTKNEDQLAGLRKITRQCGTLELRTILRLLKKDLRINAKARHILDAVSTNAYEAFQHSRDLKAICEHISSSKSPDGSPVKASLNKLAVKTNLMTPIQPMLAEACKSIEFAFSRSPNGMYAEIKYDGERVQVHHNGNQFNYFSRNLKPVVPHKVSYLSNVIPKAFPNATDLILDGEIVLVDTTTHLPLPFGTLGVHKKKNFANAQVCMYVFDCLYMNGESLLKKTIVERRMALKKVMVEIPDRVVLSEIHHVTKHSELQTLLDHVFTVSVSV